MSKIKNNEVKAVIMMMLIMLVGKSLGLIRDIVFAANFGDSAEAVSFFWASMSSRTFLDVVFASAISGSFIPIFNNYLENKGKNDAEKLASNFLNIVILLSLFIILLGYIFAPMFVNIGAYKFDAQSKSLTISLFRIMLPLILFSGIAYTFVGILQSMGEFNIPAAMSIVSNGVIIVYLLFFLDSYGVYGLAVVFAVGWLLQGTIQIPFLVKNKFKYSFIINLKDKGLKEIGRLTLPVLISTWVQPINLMINIFAMSSIIYMEKELAQFNYANNIYTIVMGVFILSIANVIFPKLSKINAANDKKMFGQTIKSTLRVMLYFLLPMMCGMMVLSVPLTTILFERKNFTPDATLSTAAILFYLCLGIIGYGLQTILSRGFYSQENGKTPMFTGIFSIGINALLTFLLIKPLGVIGPAIASATALNVSAIIMFIEMRRQNPSMADKQMFKDFCFMAISTIIMGFVISICYNNLFQLFSENLLRELLSFSITVFVGIIVYLICTLLFKINEAKLFFAIFKKK